MIVSSIKNRIRFSDENIKNKEIRVKVENILKKLNGIENIRITEEIGTLLINYNEEKIKSLEIIDSLKEYIDTKEKPKDEPIDISNYMNKAANITRKGMGRGKGKGGKSGGRNNQGFNSQDSNSKGLLGMAVNSFTGNGIVKTAVYGALGVQGYKKGKNIMQGQGKGRKSK